jgi:arsenite methyltransferase
VKVATPGLAHPEGDYGFDAPMVPVVLAASGLALLLIALLSATLGHSGAWSLFPLLAGLFMLGSVAIYVHTTRRGKFAVWADLLQDLLLNGDEWLLDMGSGRGAVLMMAAKLLPRGRAVGVDLWKSSDQSGNTLDAAARNAEREGVGGRVELETGDMTRLPFGDDSFDVVLSALAVHNIKDREGRRRAIDEASRVLKPGGRLAIADIQATPEYADRLRELGLEDVRRRGLGWRYWYGGPWMSTWLVTARKPAGGRAGDGDRVSRTRS